MLITQLISNRHARCTWLPIHTRSRHTYSTCLGRLRHAELQIRVAPRAERTIGVRLAPPQHEQSRHGQSRKNLQRSKNAICRHRHRALRDHPGRRAATTAAAAAPLEPRRRRLRAGAWRAGANVTTRLRSEVPLIFGDTTVPASEHTLFVELKSPAEWTLVVSGWVASPTFTPVDKQNTIYGAFGYTPDRDLVRVAMKVDALPYRVEELTWEFLDMTTDSGRIAIRWDRSMASTPFRVGR